VRKSVQLPLCAVTSIVQGQNVQSQKKPEKLTTVLQLLKSMLNNTITIYRRRQNATTTTTTTTIVSNKTVIIFIKMWPNSWVTHQSIWHRRTMSFRREINISISLPRDERSAKHDIALYVVCLPVCPSVSLPLYLWRWWFVLKLGYTSVILLDLGVKVDGTYYCDLLLSQQLMPAIHHVSSQFMF